MGRWGVMTVAVDEMDKHDHCASHFGRGIVFDHPLFHTRSQPYLIEIDEYILHSIVNISTV